MRRLVFLRDLDIVSVGKLAGSELEQIERRYLLSYFYKGIV